LSAPILEPPMIFLYTGGDFSLNIDSVVLVGVLLLILGIGGFSFNF